ncbi:hypothetical protein ACFXPN_39810 [Streptomyces griseorubiginosus]|uniref:hypothetical protein n=1 Tax=Streptomyces griseorubiginosus TaxID=67304 RepID=UPI00368BCCB4
MVDSAEGVGNRRTGDGVLFGMSELGSARAAGRGRVRRAVGCSLTGAGAGHVTLVG